MPYETRPNKSSFSLHVIMQGCCVCNSGFLTALECTKFVFGPDPAGELTALPRRSDSLAGLRGLLLKGRGGEGRDREGRKGKARKGRGNLTPYLTPLPRVLRQASNARLCCG